jgi:hypothetical protein
VDARQIPGSGRDAAVLKKFGRLVESGDDLGFRVASVVLALLTAGSILGLILWEVLFGIGNWPRTLSG